MSGLLQIADLAGGGALRWPYSRGKRIQNAAAR
jgi:hypothetical protein